MILQNDEYKIENDGIWISKKALESWRDHYQNVADGKHIYPPNELQKLFFIGKADVLTELLKHFEELVEE